MFCLSARVESEFIGNHPRKETEERMRTMHEPISLIPAFPLLPAFSILLALINRTGAATAVVEIAVLRCKNAS